VSTKIVSRPSTEIEGFRLSRNPAFRPLQGALFPELAGEAPRASAIPTPSLHGPADGGRTRRWPSSLAACSAHAKGWLILHESGTYVRLIEAGAALFA
jgi:hypothetical protein